MVTVQVEPVLEPLVEPPHPATPEVHVQLEKSYPETEDSLNITDVPSVKLADVLPQVVPQLIPEGFELTVPAAAVTVPPTFLLTLRVRLSAVALTLAVQVPVLLFESVTVVVMV